MQSFDGAHDPDLYKETLLDSARQADAFGTVKRIDKELVGKNSSCGDSILWQIQLSEDGKKIEALQWQGVGCVISRASANAVVELIRQHPDLDAIRTWKKHDVGDMLGLEEISPGREKCLMLGLKTLQTGLVEGQKNE